VLWDVCSMQHVQQPGVSLRNTHAAECSGVKLPRATQPWTVHLPVATHTRLLLLHSHRHLHTRRGHSRSFGEPEGSTKIAAFDLVGVERKGRTDCVARLLSALAAARARTVCSTARLHRALHARHNHTLHPNAAPHPTPPTAQRQHPQDGTLVNRKSDGAFAKSVTDWKWWNSKVSVLSRDEQRRSVWCVRLYAAGDRWLA
jgi:hypothetical protein